MPYTGAKNSKGVEELHTSVLIIDRIIGIIPACEKKMCPETERVIRGWIYRSEYINEDRSALSLGTCHFQPMRTCLFFFHGRERQNLYRGLYRGPCMTRRGAYDSEIPKTPEWRLAFSLIAPHCRVAPNGHRPALA